MARQMGVLLLLLVGCGDDGSCVLSDNDGAIQACIEYGDGIAESDARSSCEGGAGVWQERSCDTTDAAARCDLFGSSTIYYEAYLVSTGITLEELRASCEDTTGDFTEL